MSFGDEITPLSLSLYDFVRERERKKEQKGDDSSDQQKKFNEIRAVGK